MLFRELKAGELEALRERSGQPYDKLPPPADAEESIVGVDESGTARIVMRAERVAEIYMVIDHEWKSPAMRWAMIEQAHAEMRKRLEAKGYKVAYSFFADGVPNGYIRRLIPLGWVRVVDRCIRFAREAA